MPELLMPDPSWASPKRVGPHVEVSTTEPGVGRPAKERPRLWVNPAAASGGGAPYTIPLSGAADLWAYATPSGVRVDGGALVTNPGTTHLKTPITVGNSFAVHFPTGMDVNSNMHVVLPLAAHLAALAGSTDAKLMFRVALSPAAGWTGRVHKCGLAAPAGDRHAVDHHARHPAPGRRNVHGDTDYGPIWHRGRRVHAHTHQR